MKHHPRQWVTSTLLMFASLTCLRPASLAMSVEWTEIHFDIYISALSTAEEEREEEEEEVYMASGNEKQNFFAS